ncbi:acetoacetyl-CoA synthetase [Oceanobacillus iheyensis HTE831]|uniref:Acetoacetyl-CoA synthetase n=1 Tax=Oceanobacillus iheyensis (strain DSM 14371 / CIP 107618 / JCM 11309 / KCTC 3954 / HTE831) TaxID=221109 RepID=Q8ESW2_OCEIH|nr:acetoacetate--CoA ligase [Oceanobacillus iheyensis]BAC12460.1 acetoacetyl-CoA synthetase [Oceanobacillus iheyensis HTE831]
MKVEEGTLLWEPSDQQIKQSNMYAYQQWLANNKQLHLNDYASLWKWSVDDISSFWETIWEYFNVISHHPYQHVISSTSMPGSRWFKEAKVNYAEHVFKHKDNSNPAIIHASETRGKQEISWQQLYQDTTALQLTLKNIGVTKGDRVVSYAPNIYETVVAFLATSSLGAIWSSASPDFGKQSVIERFQQIEPKVMITIDGYQYGGKSFDRMAIIEEIQSTIPSLEATIAIPYLHADTDFSNLKQPITWKDAVHTSKPLELTFTPVGFNDPLWVLYSSGTTGKPKAIVHSQGGMLLEHLKATHLHLDLDQNSRFFWFTTTGWMMWNFLVGGLLNGSCIILYDGSPSYPDERFLWKFAEDTKMTVFGTSASFITSSMKKDIHPEEEFDLSALKNISSTGSPLPPEGFQWCYTHVKKDIWVSSVSGGTDVCTAFLLGSPTLPVYAGELQCSGLGAKVESFDSNGNSLVNEIGELVLTKPFPCMPIFFWNDDDGMRMYHSYFDTYRGVWCHGDYIKITEKGTSIIYGRSDATINRGGIRIGTSEIYRAVDQIEEVEDSLMIDLPQTNGDSITPLFVVMKNSKPFTDEVKNSIKNNLKTHCSPRHVPTHMFEVKELPKTLNGKKIEVPIKKILMGESFEQVMNKGSLINESAIEYFINLAREWNSSV